MGALLQKLLLKVLPQSTESSEGQHVTAALGCCSTIQIDENMRHDEEDIISEVDDSSYMDR